MTSSAVTREAHVEASHRAHVQWSNGVASVAIACIRQVHQRCKQIARKDNHVERNKQGRLVVDVFVAVDHVRVVQFEVGESDGDGSVAVQGNDPVVDIEDGCV